MAQSKKWVAFKGNSIVPAAVLGEKKDRKMQAGEPVSLPASYADHVVKERFAAYCDAPKSGKKKAPKEAAIEAAQASLAELDARLDGMAADDAARAEVEQARDAAAAALAELEAGK